MGYFNDADEVYEYIGGVFRQAGEDADVGPRLRAAISWAVRPGRPAPPRHW